MKPYRNTILEKTAAFALLCMLLIIQVIHVSHAHPPVHDDAAHIKAVCAICDLHLAKDATLPGMPVLPSSAACYHPLFQQQATVLYPGFPAAIASRGPPSMPVRNMSL